jgi:hypothetical protein
MFYRAWKENVQELSFDIDFQKEIQKNKHFEHIIRILLLVIINSMTYYFSYFNEIK